MRPHAPTCLFLLVLTFGLAACDHESAETETETEPSAREASESAGVSLSQEDQARLGIRVAPLKAAEFQERVEGVGIVIDAQSVVEVMANLRTAEAAAAASKAALDRAQDLFAQEATVSREVVEGAQRQAAADDAALAVARTRSVTAFGAGAPWLGARRRLGVMNALGIGAALVVRVSFPGGLGTGTVGELSLRRLGAPGDGEWQASEVWPGPADPAVPGPALFAYVGRAGDLAYDERVVASITTGGKLSGVVLPTSAVVFAGGQAWYYAVPAADRFVREPVDLDQALGTGYFLTGVTPGKAQAVIAGAGLLLARETSGVEEQD